MSKIICFGEILVDFVAKGFPGSLTDATAFEKFSGGAPANTATALARLGADVAMLGSVGADYFGEYLKKELGIEKKLTSPSLPTWPFGKNKSGKTTGPSSPCISGSRAGRGLFFFV